MFKIILAIILAIILLSGCTIHQDDLVNAEKACLKHDGIYSITKDTPFVDVHCRDGTYINDVGKI